MAASLLSSSPSPVAVLLSAAALLYIVQWLASRSRQDVHRVPRAPSKDAHWLWGHELATFKGEATETYTKWAARCGSLFRVKGALFHPDIIVAADHAAVHHIFHNADDYVKSPAFRPPVANVLGKGLVWAEGEEHKTQRRIISPAFSGTSYALSLLPLALPRDRRPNPAATCCEGDVGKPLRAFGVWVGGHQGHGGRHFRVFRKGKSVTASGKGGPPLISRCPDTPLLVPPLPRVRSFALPDPACCRSGCGHGCARWMRWPLVDGSHNSCSHSHSTPRDEQLESRLTNHVLAAGGAATVNITEYTSTCTLDIIGRVAFGHDFKSGQSLEAKEIHASWLGHVNTGLGFGGFVAMLVMRAVPFITLLLTKLPLEAIRAGGRIREITTKLSMRLLESGSVSEKGRDIMSILVNAQRGSKARGLTPQQIVENISTFIMVGHETTAGSLSFTLLELARHPDVQARLREEIRSAGRELSYDDIQRLEFLDAVVKEGLRMHPASPQTERVALKDDVIPLSTPITLPSGQKLSSLRVRAGQVFHIPFTTMNTNPAVWGPDGAEFKPARWLTPGGVPSLSELPSGWSGITTFCDGPRNCIGYRLAIFEFKVILATLVRSLEFHETTAQVVRKISPTLQPVVDGRGGLLPLHVTLAQ
ncbi:hypothetical protein ONZ51_g12775 [Trametes cubensis]|uniref:Cytochrome P450 n=2 Tax=Trametes cubensis TaxID=1111947 RepID=A0AAD7TF64_9APHY|nr:hypothetical protein ONZ51_g12775 [Trametes cubensis]